MNALIVRPQRFKSPNPPCEGGRGIFTVIKSITPGRHSRMFLAGIQVFCEVLDPGACPGPRSGVRRGDGLSES